MRESTANYYSSDTLPSTAAFYGVRSADDELFRTLRAGDLAYILEPTGVGKSLLITQTAARLRREGAAAAVIDCAAVKGCPTAESWYAALLDQIVSETGLGEETAVFYRSNARLGCLQRWMAALRQVALPRLGDRSLTLFVDGVESVRSLPFSTDEFFAGIRQWHNARRSDLPTMGRLTFCLSGAATPESLVVDPRTTPLNVGRRVHLPDFTEAEAALLATGTLGAGRDASDIPGRIHYWTGGHPVLTQQLYAAVAGDPSAHRARDLDRIVASLFAPGAPEADAHTGTVARNILHETDAPALLARYAEVLAPRGRVDDSSGDPLSATLLISGLVRSAAGRLQPRNRIYERVFDATWISTHAPAGVVRRPLWSGWPIFIRAVGPSAALSSR
jgi:hypothetical protein